MVVLVGVSSLSVRAKPDGGDVVIGVVRDRDLLGALYVRRSYSREQVQRIADAAVRPETWSPLPLPAADTAAMLAEFSELENDGAVAGARERRAEAYRGAVTAPARQPNTRARSRSGSNRRGRRRPSPVVSLLQLAGLAMGAYFAINVLTHH